MSQSSKMRKAIDKYIIPSLTSNGFIGKHPHYKKVYEDRIELLTFQNNKYGNSFTIEISTIFLDAKRDSNFYTWDFETAEEATVWSTNIRYRLKGMFDGWFYYTDVYCQKIGSRIFYNAVSESKARTYVPLKNEKLVQKADEDMYCKVCCEVNKQLKKAYKWWDAFYKNNKLKMKLLEIM